MNWKLNKTKEEVEIRKKYGETLESLIQEDANIIVCDADLASSSGAGYIYEKYPEKSVNFGISEQNMISAGAGMSFTGLKPYVHSFAPFVSRRVMDQIYISLGFARGNMHIYASDPGYWSQYNGATHTTFEDIAIMRSIPNISVVAPSDAVSFAWILKYYEKHGGIFYNRCTRKAIPLIYSKDSEFEYGKGQLLQKGKDVVLIAIGASVFDALEAAKEIEQNGISVSVVDLFFIKPLDIELIHSVVSEHKLVVTIENHSRYGGIGELIGTEMAKLGVSAKLKQIAIEDRYGEVGSAKYLKEVFKITRADIVKAVFDVMKNI